MGVNAVSVPILAYHKVNNSFEIGITRVSVPAFEKQIKYLYEHNYYTISLTEFKNNSFNSSKYHPVIITFDDADESVYENVFPILDKYGFKATVFVVSDYVGKDNTWDYNLFGNRSRHLNWQQIQLLSKKGWEIGSHTASHLDLTGLSADQIVYELEISKMKIENEIDKPVDYLSYPFNRFNERTILHTKQAGYKAGCSLFASNYYAKKFDDYVIPRLGVYLIDTINAYKYKLSGSKFELAKQRVISFFSIGTVIYNLIKNKNKY
jgi:peptidoglycan/xylan/chitin deacetylase (PgdA/CDA1 family)